MTQAKPKWHLFLDDMRIPPEDNMPSKTVRPFWTLAQSTAEAIELVKAKGMPDLMSLDHDLGGEDKSLHFLRWLSDEFWDGKETIPAYFVHSANPVGARNIMSFMDSWKRSQGL
jgi:hypothetical protein